MTFGMRGAAGARLTFVAAVALTAAVATPPAGATSGCTTPASPDGHEPPCNPALADSPWPMPHRNSYAQASSAFPGPAAGQPASYQGVRYLGVSFANITGPYPDGRRNIFSAALVAEQVRPVVKVDEQHGRLIGAATRRGVSQIGTTSGVYSLLDRDNRQIVPYGRAIEVWGDARSGSRTSQPKLLVRYPLPARALCRPNDEIVGLTMRYDGRLAFATRYGMVGTISREPESMSDEALRVASINGEKCADPAVPEAALELISNSIAADEHGGMYPASNRAQYRFDDDGTAVTRAWRAEYAVEPSSGGVRLTDGTGSTPTLMGTGEDDDRFVVITDGQRVMHLTLLWRDEIPEDWEPIAPGKDRRIACEVPITFDDPTATDTVSEQSVVVRGYASYVPNNQLRDAGWVNRLSDTQRVAVSGFLGQDPKHAPYGLERIDWDPETRTCKVRWVNRDVSIPNGVPSMSAATNLVYGVGQRSGVWGLEGVDADSGASRLWIPAGKNPVENGFYSPAVIGLNGDLWTGTIAGLGRYRAKAAG